MISLQIWTDTVVLTEQVEFCFGDMKYGVLLMWEEENGVGNG